MTAVMALLVAATGTPTCPAPVGEPVAITATLLPVEAVGGAWVPEHGSPPPGAAHVGLIGYRWGLLLQSDDPRFADFDFSPGAIHSASSGCWFNWDTRRTERRVEGIDNPHIAESGYTVGYTHRQPASWPTIEGYRFASADKAFSPDYAWVGVWNAADGSQRSQLVAFDDRHRMTLATLPFRFGALDAMPSPDTPALGITLVGEGKDHRPIPYLLLSWMSGMRETTTATPAQ